MVSNLGEDVNLNRKQERTYVKSPLASLCLACSSFRNRVSVMMLVLTFSPLLLSAMMPVCLVRLLLVVGEFVDKEEMDL